MINTFFSRISKPILPDYDPGDINKIYLKKEKINQKHKLQEEIAKLWLRKYKEEDIFPEPPHY